MSTSVKVRRRGDFYAAAAFGFACLLANTSAQAQTLEQALSRAYLANPTLNSQRASVRATDEQVPQALSGYRPIINATGDVGVQRSSTKLDDSGSGAIPDLSAFNRRQRAQIGGLLSELGSSPTKGTAYPRGVGIQGQQTIYDGQQTYNRVRTAESNILGAREQLRNSEQNVLFDAAQAYMDVLRDYAILDVRKNNVDVLQEELRAARERFNVGEVTRTDTAQAEAAVEGARTAVSQAEANLNTSRATYRQIVGEDIGRPRAAKSIDKLLPKSLGSAINLSQAQHPAILAAFHGVDAATLQIRVLEGALLPQLGVEAAFSRRWDDSLQQPGRTTVGSLVGRLTIPIYQGGSEYSSVRQAKETAGQRRLEADISRDQVRQAVVSAWGNVESTTAQISSAQAQIEANQVALNGVREEAKVGQRTTLDVLNAQQLVLDSRVTLIQAQHDRVVASYALMSSVGWLTAAKLGLAVAKYDPNVHYEQVRDKWIGLRTPDGR
ncbi:TolC family outer membrane protein [Chenggangzhangella methanolivorans]|uniref:TolC family outer membrane protein n=1 Tax=Chenggangzhangella methanolivorans TaxID=1437009 RepID=A0A9E6R847_9HYPH|nr:TolC family outer membrane protein [Chenggangzhangella methanolivorans]QZN99965.1 TolC family outer membrane protein [Chenggangzhangella methanolivorans]